MIILDLETLKTRSWSGLVLVGQIRDALVYQA